MDNLNNSNDFLMKFDENLLNNQSDWSQPDHSQGHLGDEYDQFTKEIILSPKHIFDEKVKFGDEPENNLQTPKLNNDFLPIFSHTFKEQKTKVTNKISKRKRSNSKEIKNININSEVRVTKRSKFQEQDDENKNDDDKEGYLEKKKELNRKSASQ